MTGPELRHGRAPARPEPARRRAPGGAGRTLGLVFVLAALAGPAWIGCGEFFVEPAPPAASLAVSFDLAPSAAQHGPAAAFDQADGLRVRLFASDAPLADTVLAVAAGGAETRAFLVLDLQERTLEAALEVALLHQGAPLFLGETSVVLKAQEVTEARVALSPVISGVDLPDTLSAVTALLDTVPLQGVALFATGDTVPAAPLSWITLDVNVIELSSDGVLVSLSEGSTQVVAMADLAADTAWVIVRQAVDTVEIAPPAAVVLAGSRVQLTATPRDANGYEIRGRTMEWETSDAAIARVSTAGLVEAVAPGTVTITATSEGVSGGADVTVAAPVPPAVSVDSVTAIGPGAASLWGSADDPSLAGYSAWWEWSIDPSFAAPDSSEKASYSASGGVSRREYRFYGSTDYWLRLAAQNAYGTSYSTPLSFTTPPPGPPHVRTDPAVGITASSATVYMSVDSLNGGDADIYFLWGTDSTMVEVATIGNALLPVYSGCRPAVPCQHWIENLHLEGSTTYYFQAVAQGGSDFGFVTYGDLLSFTTLPPEAPTVDTQPFTALTATAVTFGATGNSNGAWTTLRFQVSPTSDFAQVAESSVVTIFTPFDQPAVVDFSSLPTSPTYYYRVIAVNSAGSATGATLTFSTP